MKLPGLRWLIFTAVLGSAGCAQTTQPGAVGVDRPQLVGIPAGQMEALAEAEYAKQLETLRTAGKLIETGSDIERVRAVMNRLVGHVEAFREDATAWNWQVKLADRAELNASCLHGGRILVNTGILTMVGRSDDELAAILGHEMAHALREHGREKTTLAASKELLKLASRTIVKKYENPLMRSSELHDKAIDLLLTLPHSREAELEADRIGLELMARAGYDPAAALTVWRKMASASTAKSPWLSTHPAPDARLQMLESLQPVVRPLFEAAGQP
ncbi:MAG: M48 family metallopeptidase [Betaproteobacteria bacterium]|nr:M48 family metallopeptidase [Betaproteobacteria bacterium]